MQEVLFGETISILQCKRLSSNLATLDPHPVHESHYRLYRSPQSRYFNRLRMIGDSSFQPPTERIQAHQLGPHQVKTRVGEQKNEWHTTFEKPCVYAH